MIEEQKQKTKQTTIEKHLCKLKLKQEEYS